MYLWRDNNGCKGLRKYFCIDCGCSYCTSMTGNDKKDGVKYLALEFISDTDYMYTAFRNLAGNQTVTVTMDLWPVLLESCNGGEKYEKDNDYEKYDLMHQVRQNKILVEKCDERGRDTQYWRVEGTFEKGKKWEEYYPRLFPRTQVNSCPFCGSKNLVYYKMSYPTNEMARDILKNFKNNITNLNTAGDFADMAEQLPAKILTPVTDANSVAKEYLENLIGAEKNIMFFKKRLDHLYNSYWESMKLLCDGYVASVLPEPKTMPAYPQWPEPKKVPLFGAAKVKAENAASVAHYRDVLAEIDGTKTQYDIERQYETMKRAKKAANAFQSRDVDLFTATASEADLQKAKIVCREVAECEEHLKTAIKNKKELLSLNVIYPKYLDFPAITTIYEYLQVGRCSTLTGPDGAYNLYEHDLQFGIVIGKLDKIVNSLEQIKQNQFNTYQILESIEINTSMMNASMDKMLENIGSMQQSIGDIAQSAQNSEYYNQKTAYYSEVAAREASTLSFIERMDHGWPV